MVISKFLKIFIVLSFVGAIAVHAAIIPAEVTGHGIDRDGAIKDGIKQAVAQVTGITLEAEDLSGIEEASEDVQKDDKVSGYSKLSQNSQSKVFSKTQGYIDGYKILSEEKDKDNIYVLKMVVDVEKYVAPGAYNNRYSLAVIGMRAAGGRCYGDSLSETAVRDEATRALVSSFLATRRFSVLDRDEQEAYDFEKAIIDSTDTSMHEQTKLGKVKGTDYVVTGRVKDVSVKKRSENISLTGETVNIREAKATVEYKLLIFATRQVKVSSSVTVSLGSKEIGNKNCSDILALLMKKAAEKITTDCIENIYPPKVIRVRDKDIYINMGGASVKVGSTYGIYAIGADLIDPYTGESLGSEESRVGMLKITDVKPKYSVGRIVEGNIADISVNQICRHEVKAK